MNSIPTLSDLVGKLLLDRLATPRDPIRQIGEAERLAGELTHLGESLVGYFVEQARADGVPWADISAPRGLSRRPALDDRSKDQFRCREPEGGTRAAEGVSVADSAVFAVGDRQSVDRG
jgi:hypothetical protein